MPERNSTSIESAVNYYRMSTSGQEQSIPEQRAWARGAVTKSGYELAAEFTDEAIPGSEVERRADLQALIEFFEKRQGQKRPVRHLFVWDTDRFSRASSIRTAAVLDRLMMAGLTHIHTSDEVYDLEEDLDVVLLNLRQDLSKAAYAKSIGKNVLRSRQARARLGLWPGGPVPRGYLLGEDGHLKPDPVWAPIIRWIYQHYLSTADSLGDVCRKLNDDPSVPKPKSGEWGAAYVYRLLTRPVYLGTVVYGERACGKYYRNVGAGQGQERVKGNHGRKINRLAEPGSAILTEGAHEPLVSRQLFEAVGRKLAGNRWSKEHHSGRRGGWVLTGMAYCGSCGRRLTGRTYRHRRGEARSYVYRRLFCPGRWDCGADCQAGEATQEVVLQELAALVKQEFGKPARVERIGKQIEKLMGQQEREDKKRRDALAAKLAALDRDLATAGQRMLTLPPHIARDLEKIYEGMKQERAEVAADLARTEESRQVGQEEAKRMREALADLGRLEEVIADKPPDLVRDLLGRIVEKVTLHFAEPGAPDALGRRKRPLAHVDVTFRPEVAHLFSTGSNQRYCRSSSHACGHDRPVPSGRAGGAPDTV